MQKMLISQILLGCLFSTVVFAEPQLVQKPVQCGSYDEVYTAYIEPNNLSPLFTGVSTIRRADGRKQPMPVVFYLNSDDGRWLWIETNQEETCVINIGDGWDANVSTDELHSLLSRENT
jgi:hypothetical protein